MEFCDLKYGCHIINKTQTSVIFDHSFYTGQLIEFIQINDMPSGIQLFKTWSILSLTFHRIQMNQIPIMCSLDNQQDYMLRNNDNNNVNVMQPNRTSHLKHHIHLNDTFGYIPFRSNIITMNLLYIDKVYIEIYSNPKSIFTSSIKHSTVVIENQPVQLGCFYEKTNVPINANYEYTFFIQLSDTTTNHNDTLFNISSLSTIHSMNNHYHNITSLSMTSSKRIILHRQLKYHIIEFIPYRKFHKGRIYCQISIKIKKPIVNTMDPIVSLSSQTSLRSWSNQISNVDNHLEDDSTDDPVLISSMGYIDLNIYYGPHIDNRENQFYILYPCSIFGKKLKMLCWTKSTDKLYITQEITLQCQTDFNPSGRIQWFLWKSNNTQTYLTNGSNLQLTLDQLQSSLEMITVNSKNLWIMDKEVFNDHGNYLPTDDPIKLDDVNFQIHLWKFTCIASSLGFDSQSANRFIIQAEKPFVHSHSHVNGILGKSIHLICNVVSYPEPNFTYPIWLHNGEYIEIEDSYGNDISPMNSTIEDSKFPISLTHHFVPKYKIIHRKYAFGWIITLKINNLDLNDEGIYQCSFTNLMGSSSYEINLYLNHTLSMNQFIIIIVSCFIILLIILLFSISLYYTHKQCQYFEWLHHYLCIKCKFTLNRKPYHKNDRRYNQKPVGYYTAVDLSEVIQNSLIDDDYFDVINNKKINQSFHQPYLIDPVISLNQSNDYVTCNPILNDQQSTLQEKCLCEFKNNCEHQLNSFNIPSKSNCSTCSHIKPLIQTKNNNDNDHDCCELKQYPLPSKTLSGYYINHPSSTVKVLHNQFRYKTVLRDDKNVNNDDVPLGFNQTPLFNHIYSNNVCLNELTSNSMINDQYSTYCQCNIKSNQTQGQYFTLPPYHHCMLYSNIMNKNIYTFNNQQDQCIHCTLKPRTSNLAPKLNETFSYCDNKVSLKNNVTTIIDTTNGMYNHNNNF
uniref:Ig-like domain-containing protein n=1 Tax=Schistosoma mansoni TaxID=6183 RepID=A0A5K4FBF6_SCHMA